MALSIFLESALAPLVFFGCQSAALNESAMSETSSARMQGCVVTQPARYELQSGMTPVSGACTASGASTAYKNQLAGNAGPIDQGVSIGAAAGIGGSSSGVGAITPATPGSNAPVIELVANPSVVMPGQAALLVWTGDNIDRCVADGGWSGLRDVAGSESTSPLSTDTTFILRCDGPAGVTVNSVMVSVFNDNPAPTLNFSASPELIASGTASMLSWSTTNVDSCTASGSWSGTQLGSGTRSTGPLSETSTYTLNCTGPGGSVGDTVVVSVDGAPPPPATFAKVSIEQDQAPWGKNLADVDGDGELDIVVGGGLIGSNVFWYRAPTWQKFQIGSVGGGDDLQTGDINGDGALDVVVNRDPIAWYENPVGSGGNPEDPWTVHPIANYRSHDIEIVDMNGDNKLDIVIRLAGITFGTTRVFLQGNSPTTWTTVSLSNDSNGTGGLAVADIDDDGRPDVIGDGYWLRQPASNITDGGAWQRYTIGSWPAGSSIDVADLNGDGNLDVSLAVSEVGVGQFAWFAAPDNPLTQSWTRNVIDTSVEDVHRHHLVDMNNDGQLDIVFAEMYQSQTDRVGIFYNDGNAESWTLDILEDHASHNLAIGDIGNDGDMDILGANWQLVAPADGDIFLWINQTN